MTETNPFAEWLCRERAVRGVNRTVMAKNLALSETTLREYELGRYVAKPALFERLQSVIGPAPKNVVEWMHLHALTPHSAFCRHDVKRSPFGQWLHDGRRKLNLKQREFSLKVGLAPNAIGRIERGDRFVSKEVLDNIETLLGKMPDDVKAWADEKFRQNFMSRTVNSPEEDSPFGRLLRAERHCVNVTRKELAKQIGVALVQIQRFEEGTRSVSIETLEKLAVFFGHETVPQAWKDALFEGNQTPRARSSISLDNLPPLGQAMRRQRLELGLSIREIADKMGISSVTISGYESGKKNISDIRLQELVVAYEVPEKLDEWFKLRHHSLQDPQSNAGGFNEALSHFGRLLRNRRQELPTLSRLFVAFEGHCCDVGNTKKYRCSE